MKENKKEVVVKAAKVVKKAVKKEPTVKKVKVVVPKPLEKGQLWKMGDIHIEIMEVGKTLTHYRRFQNQKRVPTSLGAIRTVQDYLRDNGAKLVKKKAA